MWVDVCEFYEQPEQNEILEQNAETALNLIEAMESCQNPLKALIFASSSKEKFSDSFGILDIHEKILSRVARVLEMDFLPWQLGLEEKMIIDNVLSEFIASKKEKALNMTADFPDSDAEFSGSLIEKSDYWEYENSVRNRLFKTLEEWYKE